jgi:hypothetical protein
MSEPEQYILKNHLRGYVLANDEFRRHLWETVTAHFKYGQLVAWHTQEGVWEIATIAGEPVVIAMTVGIFRRTVCVTVYIRPGTFEFNGVEVIRLAGTILKWNDITYSDNNLHPDEAATLRRLREVDYEPILAPYKIRALEMLAR